MESAQITVLLERWQSGDEAALHEVMPYVHAELRRLADNHMRGEKADHTLQSTALVNEAYLRLVDIDLEFADRGHFLALASKVMRRVLVDHARGRSRKKRGDGVRPLQLDDSAMISDAEDPQMVDLDDALNKLEGFDAKLAGIVEMIYFGGLTTQEVADYLGVSRVTLNKDIKLAKAWLYKEME